MATGIGLTGQELFPRFSDTEYARRNQSVREAMEKEGLEAIVICGGMGSPEVHYLVNYIAQSPCWLVFPREGGPPASSTSTITSPAPSSRPSSKMSAGTVARPPRP